VYIWDVRDGSRTDFNMVGSTSKLCWVRKREQKHVLVGCEGGMMEMWDVDCLQQVQVLSFPSSQALVRINAVASSDDGSLGASGSWGGALAIYDAHTGEVIHSQKHRRRILSVAFSPTVPILVFGSEFAVGLWFYSTGCIVTFPGHSTRFESVVFSPNGRFIAFALDDYTLRIWETEAQSPRCVLDTTDTAPDDIYHSKSISCVQFSNDGQLVVSVPADKTVKVWDTHTGTLSTTLRLAEHTLPVEDAIILPDNMHVVSRGSGSILSVWDWQKGKRPAINKAIAMCHGGGYTLFPYTCTLSEFPLGFISTHHTI
jgi:WD40 repeat protein